MKGKVLLVVGLGVGYVLGSRAGRERYEQIKTAANKMWNMPVVQRQVNQAEDFVKDKAPDVAEFIADGAKKLVAQLAGRPGASAVREPERVSAPSAAEEDSSFEKTSAARKPAARKPATKKPATGRAASKSTTSK